MDNITYKAKIAIIKVLTEIAHADNIVKESEVAYLNKIVDLLNLDNDYQTDVECMTQSQALTVISNMSATEKCEVAKMMGRMIIADNDINYNEVKTYNSICETCGIENDFDVNDYPELSLSGSFVNPESALAEF